MSIHPYTCPMHPEVLSDGPGDCPRCGMALVAAAGATPAEDEGLEALALRVGIAAALSLPLVLISMAPMLGFHGAFGISPHAKGWVEFALATPVVFWCGWPLLEKFWSSIRAWSLNMYSLIGLGVGLAYTFSFVALVAPGIFPAEYVDHDGAVGTYFEAAAVIVALILFGDLLQMRAIGKTGDAIRQLLSLAPNLAWRIRSDGYEEQIPIADVRVGDQLRVKPGEKVPADGTVLEGGGRVDESMMTGEPGLVAKWTGDRVMAATLNSDGALLIRAERVGADTLLSRIVNMVRQAQATRAPVQRFADAVASSFVQAVAVIAVVTAIVWGFFGPEPRLAYALLNAVSVLIIACPCALGLATPITMTVAMGQGALVGVLFRNADAVERMREINTIVVDKTGTLTVGRPGVEHFIATRRSSDEMLALAAAVEVHSEHPIARAIVESARARKLALPAVTDFRAHAGLGISAMAAGHRLLVGNARFLALHGVDAGGYESRAVLWQSEGKTVVFIAVDGALEGVVSIADLVRDGAPEAVAELKAEGVRIVMLTGDSEVASRAVARKLGIDEVIAEALPEEKAMHVKRLQSQGLKVAMAGDGINDALALALSDIGIAMGTGTDIAMESASVALVKGDLRGIARARSISRAAMQNVKQNLAFAFGYNGLGIPVAAGVLYPFLGILLSPMVAAIAMAASSLSVVGNALRLRSART